MHPKTFKIHQKSIPGVGPRESKNKLKKMTSGIAVWDYRFGAKSGPKRHPKSMEKTINNCANIHDKAM